MPVEIIYNEEMGKKHQAGLNRAVDLVKITIGSRGRNVSISKGNEIAISNDGEDIINSLKFKDPFENQALSILKDVVLNTSKEAKGGRTASALLTQAIFNEGMRHATLGCNVMDLKSGIEKASFDVARELKAMAKPVKSKADIKKVATISSESEIIGDIVSDIVYKVGKDGSVHVEESQSTGITAELVEGIRFDRGYISPYMVTNNRKEAEAIDVPIIITDKQINAIKDILPLWDHVINKGNKFMVIVADDINGEALDTFLLNRIQGRFVVIGIKTSGMVEVERKALLEDIALTVGATVVSGVMKFDDPKVIGKAHKVIATSDQTEIVGIGRKPEIARRITNMKTLKATAKPYEIELLDKRIARLSNGVAIIKVGAPTEKDRRRSRKKVEDGVTESMSAIQEGIVIGGGTTLIRCVQKLFKSFTGSREQEIGYNIVLNALSAPLRNIAANAGRTDADVIINEIKSKKGNIGYNSTKNEIVKDMIADGVLDAVKSLRVGVEKACNGASLLLTLGGAVDIEEEKPSK